MPDRPEIARFLLTACSAQLRDRELLIVSFSLDCPLVQREELLHRAERPRVTDL